jgi:cobalt-zinc-cadmium resistance protein CzcA
MLQKAVDWSIKNRIVVLLLFGAFFVLATREMFRVPIDAFPDTTPVQVQINTVADAMAPEEIEKLISAPIELSISGLPGLTNVRSVSKFGFSQIVVTFDDKISINDARQLVLEKIVGISLPENIEGPTLGPISTGLGEVFHYVVKSTDPSISLQQVRTIHDIMIKPELRKVPGVAEINSWGGYELQYQVILSPEALVKYKLTIDDIHRAISSNNRNISGGELVSGGQSMLVHGLGRITNPKQIADIVIKAEDGVPIQIRDVAQVRAGHEIRRGAVTSQGEGEVVLGLGFMLMGENSKEVTEALKCKLNEIRPSIPSGIDVQIVYDRTGLVQNVISTVTMNLLFGALFVTVLLFFIIGNIRVSLLVTLSIPLAMLFVFFGMHHFAIAASLLSLGAIDFGAVVDGSVVMTDEAMRKLVSKSEQLGRPLTKNERLEIIINSSRSVIRPIVYGIGIVIVVFLPILTLQSYEGKLFRPMAYTFIFALIGALILGLFLTPILSYYFLPKKASQAESRLTRFLKTRYSALLSISIKHARLCLSTVAGICVLTTIIAFSLGGEFVPRLSEGALVINTIRLAGVSVDETVRANGFIEKTLLDSFPNEIDRVWGRIGSAEITTDPMGTELTDYFITLKPRSEWKKARSQNELTTNVKQLLDKIPGANFVYTQPIEMRMNEMLSGIRADVGVKILGTNFDTLSQLSTEIQKVLTTIKGTSDLAGEQITGQPIAQLTVDRENAARLGVSTGEILDIAELLAKREVGEVITDQQRIPLVLRLPDELRTDATALTTITIPTQSGLLLSLHEVVNVQETEGPSTINHEWGRRLIKVQCNVRDRDIAGFVNEARQRIKAEVSLPSGYFIEWGGQFENMERANNRLMIVVPLALILIFVFLYFSLRNVKDVVAIYLGIPLAAIGGILFLKLRGMPFSVSAAIGFIALSGIVVLNGQILVSAIRQHLKCGQSKCQAIHDAAVSRLQPVLATAITDVVGFIPMVLSSGVGAEIQRPLATVLVGGILSSTLLTLFILPMLYTTFLRKGNDTTCDKNN